MITKPQFECPSQLIQIYYCYYQFEIIFHIISMIIESSTKRSNKIKSSVNFYKELSQSCQIKFKPQQLEFENIEVNQKYEMIVVIKNEGKQNEKIRIIHPVSPYFSIKNQTNPFIIASGLSFKVTVFFHLKTIDDCSVDLFQDHITFVGSNFKKKILLKATKPNFVLIMPKVFKLGLLRVGKQSQFSIPIQNIGKEDVQIRLMQTSSPTISIQDPKIVVKKQGRSELHIRVKISTPGLISQYIYFPNGQSIQLKGVCTQETIEIYNKLGQALKFLNFGNIFIGQKISEPFYIANNSPSKIEGLVKVFDKNLAQYANLKVDLGKMAFVNRSNPKKTIQQQNSVNFKCNKAKFSIEPYSEWQNHLTILKQPSQEELKLFTNQAFHKNQSSARESIWNTVVTINQVLYIRIISTDQPIKIPLQFNPIMPKIQVSHDKFEFFNVKSKQTSKKTFSIKNCNEKPIKIKLQNLGCFYFEGQPTILPSQSKDFQLCFRPLIPGEYSEHLKISLFDSWVLYLKAYGLCNENHNTQGRQDKQNFKITLNKSSSLNSSKSTRYLSEQRKKRIECQKIQLLKNKLSERENLGFVKNADQPIDLAFDACENPKVLIKKNLALQNTCYGVFFNKQQYARTIAVKNRNAISNASRLNVKQIIKFSEELTPNQLQKIEVKCDRLDFGNVFVGSKTQKQLIILNKNNKPILLQLDLGNHEAISETKVQLNKIGPYSEARLVIKLKPSHLGMLRIPLCYIINKQHIFQIDVVANVTLINLGFSTTQLDFSFAPNDTSLQKSENLTVTNYGSTSTKFVIIQPVNKAFTVVGNKQQEVQPNSFTNVTVKYKPLEGSESGQTRVDSDKIIIKVIGGAENMIKCEGVVLQPKYSIKETEVTFSEIFISMPQQSKLTFRNNSKFEAAIKIELYPSSLSEVISLDQKIFSLTSEERKQIIFTMMSHEAKAVKGHFIVNSRGGKTFKIPININFCFPLVEVVGVNEVDLGTVHIMTNHFEREIALINRMKTPIKLESNRNQPDKLDYVIEFLTADQKVELTMRDTYNDSQKQQEDKIQLIKKSIHNQDKIVTANHIKNSKNILKTITLMPGVETKFKIKFVPKLVKQYDLKIPLYMHKATRDIDPIPQKIKCKAVQPLFYISPYSISFNNVIISENKYAHKRQFEVINPHNKEVDWQIQLDNEEINNLFIFQEKCGKLKAKQSKKLSVYFHPIKEGVSTYKVKFFSNLDPEIGVQLQVISTAVSPRINFNKTLLILPVVPIKTQSKGTIDIENFGYEAVTISKAKFTQTFQGIDLKYTFLDGKLLSLAKTKLKVQISFKSDIPISFTTCLEIFDEYGDKISIPISATADNCVLTTYPYLEMNNSTIVYDRNDNTLKLLVSKIFCTKNKQTNISGSSAVTGNFIKKWCNYELNIQIQSFPDGFIQSKGELLYEMIIKMTNGRPIVKKPCFTSEGKLSRILELHNYYSEVIKALQIEGAFLNHIRPEYLLNLSDYLLYMLHKQSIIQEDQFQCISHDSWTVLFYQLCKLYVQPAVNDKFIQKFNSKQKLDRTLHSWIYSENEILILGFLNEFLGEDKVYSMSDQAKLFQVIQRILQRTFKLTLGQELAKLKINADSLMLHEFLILVSKFLFSHLSQFGLSMYLEPNDLFTMGHKEFILFFISLMQNLINFQSYSVVQFESASGQKNEKIIEIQNPSKKKKIKYWVRISGSANFKTNQKQIEIEPENSKMLKITYHCKKNTNQQAQLILLPVKDDDYFIHAHSLNFLLKNILISKTVVKKITMKVHLYDVKSINLDVELPTLCTSPQFSEYDVKLIGSQFIDELQYPNYYLIQPGLRSIRNGKDKCQIKIAPLQLGELAFKIILVSCTFQEYIYEFNINVSQPHISHTFNLEPMISDKEQNRTIKIPYQNELKEQCIKFHREMNKQRQKNNKRTQPTTAYKIKTKTCRSIKYELQFIEESAFILGSKTVELGVKDKFDKGDILNKVEISAEFDKSYKEYRSLLLVKNEQLNDYRVYALSTSVAIKPKIFNIKMNTKARQVVKSTIPNKMNPFIYRLDRNVPELKIQQTESGDLILSFQPRWLTKEEVDLYVDNTQILQQHIYRIKLESKFPDPIETVQILASKLFVTNFQVDLRRLQLKQKQLSAIKLRSDIHRKNEISIRLEEGVAKLVGKIYPSQQQELSSIKLLLPKSDQYYEYMINIKNAPAIDLGILHLSESIGQVKKLIIPQIVTTTNDFIYEYNSETYLSHEYVASEANQLKRSGKIIQNFCIVFKPTKEVQSEQIFKFKSNSKQYIAKVKLNAKKLEAVTVPVIITENLDKKSSLIIVANNLDCQGTYQCVIEDSNRFRVDNQNIQMKSKDKIQLKINFIPKFIGDVCKTKLLLKSKTLPQLTYYLEGISKFKCKQVRQQIEGFEGIAATKELAFTNQFNQKERFKFEVVSTSKNYCFESDIYHFTRDVDVGEVIKFTVWNKCPGYNGENDEQTKITVLRLNNRKIVKEYYLCLSLVKKLEGKKFNWQCKARQTIFESIKLPNLYALKQIQTDPDIRKYITLNIEEKNQSEAKLKFSPLKPIKSKIINILLISNKIKFRIECHVKVLPPSIDDIITIRTAEVKETGITAFKLTNVVRQPAHYRAYFQKNHQELEVEPSQGVLEAYGKVGTLITIKFRSDIHNKRVEDKLIIETDNMYWVFKVVGVQEKILNF